MTTTPRVIVLQHVPFEGPARLASLFTERGYTLDIRRLDLGAPVPLRIEPGDALVVMGGPMGIADVDSGAYSFLRAELQLLARCIADDAPVLGVCLGAQLLAHAAGAQVTPMTDASGARRFELGWGPVALQPAAALAGLPEQAVVLHWHGDASDLPAGAQLLASTALCQNQAFQLGRQFGLQFHCEVAPEHVEAFLREDAAFVRRALGPDGATEVRAGTARHAAEAWDVGQRLLGNILRYFL